MNILVFIALTMGLWFIATGQIAYEKTSRQRKTLRQYKKDLEPKPWQKAYDRMVKWTAARLRLSAYRKGELSQLLVLGGMDMTPEEYMADAILQPLLFLAVASPIAGFLWKPLLAGIALISIILFRQKLDVAADKTRKNRELIEQEMPAFVAVAASQLGYNRDVIALFEKYRVGCGAALRAELDRTLADCRTGSVERALLRMDTRVHSKALSQVVRGLLSVCRGDLNGEKYFEQLQRDFRAEEKERLRRIAGEKPNKLKPFLTIVLLSFLAAVLFCLIYQAIAGAARL